MVNVELQQVEEFEESSLGTDFWRVVPGEVTLQGKAIRRRTKKIFFSFFMYYYYLNPCVQGKKAKQNKENFCDFFEEIVRFC